MKNKADKAIIVAAGHGTRLQPISNDTPKPLIKVNGKPMIETIISALHKNNIREIYIVVGYKKEQFEYLKNQHEGITLIENPYYDVYNNIASLYVAREHLSNTIILDGDQIIYNHEILNPNFDTSSYCAFWTEQTSEWLLQVDNGLISSCSRNGGINGYQLFSVSFWSKEDGKKLKKDIEKEFAIKKNTSIYWDDVALFCHPTHYNLAIREIQKEDIIEIDSLSELVACDSLYAPYLKSIKEE